MMEEETIPLIDQEIHEIIPNRRNQIIATVGVTMALLSTGCAVGFSGVALPAFIEPDSEIKANAQDLSWIASMVTVGCIGGNFVGGVISDLIGRKMSIILTSLISFSGWVSIATASGLPAIFLGRAFTGLATGLYSAPVQVYICEIVDPKIRGVAGATPSLTVAIGILSAFCLGSLLDWRTLAWSCSMCPFIVVIYMSFLPESPVWLMSKGREKAAAISLAWLNKTNLDSDSDQGQNETLILQKQLTKSVPLKKHRKFGKLNRFLELSVLKRLFVGSMLFFFQQFSGIFPILSYTTLIFRYSGQFVSEYLQTVLVGVIRLLTTIIAIFLVKFLKPRTLLMISGFFMFISNGILSTYFYFIRLDQQKSGNFSFNFVQSTSQILAGSESSSIESFSSFSWVPLACLLVFMGFFSIGYGVVPWFLMPELMDEDVRSLSCSIAFTFGQLCRVLTVKSFLDLVEFIGADGTFGVFAGMSLLSVIFVAGCVPDVMAKAKREEEIVDNKIETDDD